MSAKPRFGLRPRWRAADARNGLRRQAHGAVLAAALLAAALVPVRAEERGYFVFDEKRLQDLQEAFGRASEELRASGDHAYLTGAGKQEVEKALAGWKECEAKKGESQCQEPRAKYAVVMYGFMDRGFQAVRRFEERLQVDPELRWQLNAVLSNPEEERKGSEVAKRSREALFGSGVAGSGAKDQGLQIVAAFAAAAESLYRGAGGYPVVLSRQVAALENLRLFYGAHRKTIEDFARLDLNQITLELLGDGVEILQWTKGDPLQNLPVRDFLGPLDALSGSMDEAIRDLGRGGGGR